MENTRLEILKNGVYVPLRLRDNLSIRYNSVINKIGEVDKREISHSNTFTIPYVFQNIEALGLNNYNVHQLAISLNQKYEAKYYKDGTLLREGFVVINNTERDSIKLNFIDKALSLTQQWGSTTYRELLRSGNPNIPSDYQTAIAEMRDYFLDKDLVVTHLSNIPTKAYPISLFPNTLNCIGDKFNDSEDDVRYDDSFNPFQSRPIFNAYAFMELICEAYGFTPIFHDSVDWDIVKKTYMVSEGLDKSEKENSGLVTLEHDTINSVNPAHYIQPNAFNTFYNYQAAMVFGENGIAPNDISGFPSNPLGILTPGDSFFSSKTIFVPELDENVGTIRLTAIVQISNTFDHPVYGVWTNINAGLAPVIREITPDVDSSTFMTMDVTIDKDEFENPPAQGDQIIGIYVTSTTSGVLPDAGGMFGMRAIETFTPPGVVSYDEDTGEFLQENVDLTYAASRDTIEKSLTGIMHKEGILMNIDSKNKEVEFFSYGAYGTRQVAGEFQDWTQYLQEYMNPNFNTSYGKTYGITNKLGLKNPYLGNTVILTLGNQTSNSKYEDFKQNYLKYFGDVKSVDKVFNTNSPYTEYEVSGNSLVEHEGSVSSLNQRRYFNNPNTGVNDIQGTITSLPLIQNVNYTIVPQGVRNWYELIDNSVRAKPKFLIPINVAKNLDLRLPVYVGQLGGFYILEELEGYEDSNTLVNAKLIKIPDFNESSFGTGVSDTTPSISIIGGSYPPSDTQLVPVVITDVYIMLLSINFNNYVPTSATMYAEKLTGSGGTTTGTILSSSVTLNQQGNYLQDIATIAASDPITSSEEGYYNVYVEDQDGLRSSEVELYLGDI